MIAKGEVTAANLVGSLAGQPLQALIDQINAGNAYVNIHTNDGVAPDGYRAGRFSRWRNPRADPLALPFRPLQCASCGWLQHQRGAPIEGAAALHSDPTSLEQFPLLNQCDGVLDRQRPRFSAVLKNHPQRPDRFVQLNGRR